MELSQLKIPQSKISQLQQAGIQKTSDLVYYFPKKYIDRTSYTGILPEGESVILFECKSVHYHNYSKSLVEAIGTLAGTDTPIHILWYNQQFMYSLVEATKGKQVTVIGTVTFKPAEPLYKKGARYEITNPAVYSDEGTDALRIYPVYKKVPKMSDDYLNRCIHAACELLGQLPEETIPAPILTDNDLISHASMIAFLHEPPDAISLEQALKRKRFDDLLYFALRMEMEQRLVPRGSVYSLQSLSGMNKVKDALPYTLTADQEGALNEAICHIQSGKRLNALLQGDVGCGKTIVAILLMIAFATNGYQAALMAPTTILAQQHYKDLQKICDTLNIPIAFVGGGGAKTKAQKELEQRIADGSIRIIVGTQALLSESCRFKNLALVVEDEEHKYGVMQRKSLADKAAGGTHVLTMSATPIPRSLAQTIYGESLQLFTITQKPAGRKPVQTGIAKNSDKAVAFLRKSCGEKHRQAYVVCPMIAESDKVEGVTTAEAAYAYYRDALTDYGITVELVTGTTPKATASQTLQSFAEGAVSVLVSTTIIEVGVNVPNANCIIIHNAERFGLAQLHQLRGRVGRGSHEAFCCLISEEAENERLQAMVNTSDGFEIAQKDLQQRGAGDFLGIQQSGTEKFLSLALQYPQEYHKAQAAAKDILDIYSDDCLLLKQAEEDMDNQKGGEII